MSAGGRHLSGAEALMWSLDDEPALRSTFLSVSLLDHALDLDRFRAAEVPSASAHAIPRRANGRSTCA